MHVRLMQRIDYWIGVPLCAFFSLAHSLKRFLFPQEPISPKRLLCIELSEMGSAFLAYPMLKRATDKYGAENLYFLIFTKNRESVDLLKVIPEENVITISDENFIAFVMGTVKALIEIWKARIDTTIDMELFSRATAIISFFSFAKNRVGFDNFTDEGLYRGNFISHRVMLNNHQHISYNFLALIESLDADPAELPMLKKNVGDLMCDLPHLIPNPADTQRIYSRLKALYPALSSQTKCVVINPDPGVLTLRGWPTDRYHSLTHQILSTHPDAIVLLMGLPRSSSYAQVVFPKEYKDRCINFCGQTEDLSDVITLFSFCHLLITNDSGPGHLASLSRIPAIVLFGPESPQKYGPLGSQVTSVFENLNCSPCYSPANHRHSMCKNNRCLQAIEVNKVFQIVENKFNGLVHQ